MTLESVTNFQTTSSQRRDYPAGRSGSAGTFEPEPEPLLKRVQATATELRARFESIIGTHDRRIQRRTDRLPWRMICALEIAAGNRLYNGTGWLAGPDIVLTAGHCLFHPSFGGWATRVTVYPGRRWQRQPFGSFTSERFAAPAEWVAQGNREADFGCILLPEAVGDLVGWFALAEPPSLNGQRIIVSGYPEYAGSYENLLASVGQVHGLLGHRAFYDADTTDGQSGGPIWTTEADGERPLVIAIHAYEKEAAPPPLPQLNSATLLTSEKIGLIEQWQAGQF